MCHPGPVSLRTRPPYWYFQLLKSAVDSRAGLSEPVSGLAGQVARTDPNAVREIWYDFGPLALALRPNAPKHVQKPAPTRPRKCPALPPFCGEHNAGWKTAPEAYCPTLLFCGEHNAGRPTPRVRLPVPRRYRCSTLSECRPNTRPQNQKMFKVLWSSPHAQLYLILITHYLSSRPQHREMLQEESLHLFQFRA